VPAVRIALALLVLLVGIGLIAASQHISRRARHRGRPMLTASILWAFLGVLLAMNGLLQLLVALL
jgi:uncharacterized membrane protein YoaK (UPF0700 family)